MCPNLNLNSILFQFQFEQVRRGQMQLIIFAKVSVSPFVKLLGKTKENTGFLNVFPNKVGLHYLERCAL